MAIELKQQLKLTQQLVMTPQLQQAIKLLQLSRLELLGVVQQELQENPVLEETQEADEELPSDVANEQEGGDGLEAAAEAERVASAELADAAERGTENAGESPDISEAEKIADLDWQNYMDAYPQTGMSVQRDDDERRSLEATLTRRPSLTDHLEWQLQLSSLEESERRAATWIIGNIDDHGYLRSSVEEIARQCGESEEVIESALLKVQTLDPAGVAARDLRECLLLQLRALGVRDPLVRRIVEEQLESLQNRDFKKIAKALDSCIEDVAAAARVIAQLEPRPGRAFGGEDPIYITPDIYVYKIGDDFHILLNEDGLPKLRINHLYRDVLSRNSGVEKDTREYVQDKVRAALWLIKSIHQRQRTIYKVMQSIIRHQRDFFDRGIAFLKPLNLRDVAEDIGMHESTVSRVTTNKYAHTPQGIFELKYFFNSSINRMDGDAIASESVKEKIRKIIAAEDTRRPLSDQRIAEMLKHSNIDIARRTVTKYRESMHILSSTKRRQVG
jgi:RNA polymerase sigma-54 factor